jgi:NTE family protein
MEQRMERQDDGVHCPPDQTLPAPTDTRERLASDGGNRAPAKTVNLALQGGGSHGAFAWGVLDRMLEDGRLDFEGISATSAGAMNAAVLAHGLEQGGPQGARKALAGFWRRVAEAASAFALQPSPLDRFTRNHRLDFSPVFLAFDFFVRLFSPYQFNPVNFNPLRSILEECVDFERLRNSARIKLFLSATNVRTGKVRVFRTGEITVDAVLASACLPTVFHAVEIDGEAYWDGGYIGNPVIFPLIYECQSHDVVVVHLNPLTRPQVPKTAAEIVNRSNELCFNSSLMREMRAIDFITRLIDEGKITDASIKRMLIHSVDAEQAMPSLGVNSKLNADWEFLTHLMKLGRAKVADWLAANFQDLSVRSTTDFSLYR